MKLRVYLIDGECRKYFGHSRTTRILLPIHAADAKAVHLALKRIAWSRAAVGRASLYSR